MITRRCMLAASGGFAAIAAIKPTVAETSAVQTKGRNAAMEITRVGSQTSRQGPTEYFTGVVRIDAVPGA